MNENEAPTDLCTPVTPDEHAAARAVNNAAPAGATQLLNLAEIETHERACAVPDERVLALIAELRTVRAAFAEVYQATAALVKTYESGALPASALTELLAPHPN
jgi:hypothetical protein